MNYVYEAKIKPEDLEKGRVYRFKARNFFYGVWDGRDGFIGIREKLGSIYLFTEYHCDLGGQHGTVHQIEWTRHVVPDGIEVTDRLPGSWCSDCDEPVEFVPDNPPKEVPGKWYHVERERDSEHKTHPYIKANKPLFLWLIMQEEDDARRAFLQEYAVIGEREYDDDEERWEAYDQLFESRRLRSI